MLLLQCKSASCWRKWRKTGDGKCDVHSSHRATASVPEQPTASSPNMKHVWGLICLPLMGCQHSGLRGLQGRRASPPLHQSHWPAPDMSNNFLSGCSLLHIQTHTHTHTPTHTHTHTGYLDMYETWACPCAYTHFLSRVALLVTCLACRNLLLERQRIFPAEPRYTSSAGFLACKNSFPWYLLFSTCTWLPLSLSSFTIVPWSISNMPHRTGGNHSD